MKREKSFYFESSTHIISSLPAEDLTGLQHRLELPRHADLLLLLSDQPLDRRGEAARVAGEDQRVAVLAAPVLPQDAAGVGDGVVVVVGVDDPVVVT